MDKNEKKKETTCYGCLAKVSRDHIGITCPQSHDLCTECTDNFVNNTVMPELCEKNFPPKCLICCQPFNKSVFERNIKDKRHIEIFQSLNIFTSYQLGNGEIWVNCPSCGYREIRKTNELPVLSFCKNASCSIITCYYCKTTVKKETIEEFEGECDLNEELEGDGDDIKLMRKHLMTCSKFGPLKLKCEETISNGTQRTCPNPDCGLPGQKDENCTHITCGDCQSLWCYVCGKLVADCDKAEGAKNDDIFAHNAEWDENKKRCPASLIEIHDLDDEWPNNDHEAKALFHRRLILKNLRKFADDVGDEEVEKLVEVYPQVLGGFNLEEIQEVDLEKPLYMGEEEKEEYEENKKRKRDHDEFDSDEESRANKRQKID